MKKFFRELISDDNQINEQAFVGVVSFFCNGICFNNRCYYRNNW